MISSDKVLQYLLKNGTISEEVLQCSEEYLEKIKFLEMHPYKIWKGNDGKWYTYLPANNDKHRVLKKRTSNEGIEKCVIDFWRAQEYNPTLRELFVEWLMRKSEHNEISKSTKSRYERQFEHTLKDYENYKIKDITECTIEDIIFSSIHNNELTSKAFSNMRTLLYGIFKLAKRKKLISFSITEVIADIEISNKLFRKIQKSDDQLVFMDNERKLVEDYLLDNKDIINLGLLLIFKSGVRIGELSSIERNDLCNNIISIHNTEYCYEENGKYYYEVKNTPKSDAGERRVIVPKKYQWILNEILERTSESSIYLFNRNNERIRTYSFRNRLYTICYKLDIKAKSPHKIRKTYGSLLIDSDIDESIIIKQMGHTDINTTKKHYYYNHKDEQSREVILSSVI